MANAEESPGVSVLPAKARAMRAALQTATLPDYLPARMVNEFVYCPRLFYYEWVEGIFVHSADTVEGAHRHQRVDEKSDALPLPDQCSADGVRAKSVELSSERLGVIARIDLVEGDDGVVTPIDYKKGRPAEGPDGPEAWPADRAQVVVQALILRDNNYRCEEAQLYYHGTKQRVRIRIDDQVQAEVAAAIAHAREVARSGVIPPPLADSPKCPKCSLVGICLPDETLWIERSPQSEGELIQPWLIPPPSGGAEEAEVAVAEPVRRLVPARDDLRPLYVVGQGMSIGKSGGVLQVRDRERKVVQEARLQDVSQVNVFGNVTLTAAAVQGLCEGEKPVAHFSSGGWFFGLTQGLGLRNAYLRAEQFRKATDPVFCREVAGRIVAGKIRNQRTLLQRNHVEPPRDVLSRLKALADAAQGAASLETLLGIEGTAARLYFQHFAGMIKVENDGLRGFAFESRNRRPPRDPVNSLLSLAYSLLAKDLTIVCATIGLDPFWGFYHQPRFGRPALALDLMEPFRPLVADSVVITAINTRMVSPEHFVRVGPCVSLTPEGRKGLLRAYEQRLDTLVTHPLFDYRVSYRRVFEIQARLLARFLAGELDEFPPFETR